MAKAINWPEQYLNEVINENSQDQKAAIRLGSLYVDHCYYVPDEVVDIRVNHKVIRQGIIQGEMKLCKISELTEDDLKKLKSDIQNTQQIVEFLAKTYNEEVTPETTITVVYYRNISSSKDNERVDDPHM